MELRYVIRHEANGPEQVLQYRTKVEVSDYGAINTVTGDYLKKLEWTDWKDVPVVDQTK